MDPCELAAFVTAVACAVAKCTPDNEELLVWALAFGQLADTLETIAAQRALLLSREQGDEGAALNVEEEIIFR